jgi:putative cell wall-binding protein
VTSSYYKRTIGIVLTIALLVMLVPAAGFATADPNHAALKPATVAPQALVKPDSFEPDNDWLQAKPMASSSSHTFHQLANGNDADWMYFTVEDTGTPYFLATVTPPYPQSNFTDPYIKVYEEASAYLANMNDVFGTDGNLAANDDHMNYSEDAGMVFIAPHPGKYYVRVQSDDVGYANQWGQYTFYGFKGIGQRLAGADRFETALKVADMFWGDSGNLDHRGYASARNGIVVVNGRCLADSMSAGMLAAMLGSPLILTDGPDAISSKMVNEIQRLANQAYWTGGIFSTSVGAQGPGPLPSPDTTNTPKIPLYVVGGTNSVSDKLATWIDEDSSAAEYLGDIIRLGGKDRIEVAANVMNEILDMHMPKDVSANGVKPATSTHGRTVFLANGDATSDVLLAAPVANATCSELLLTKAGSIPDATKAAMSRFSPEWIVVVGGTKSVPDSVYQEASALVGGNIERIAGSDAPATSKLLVDWEIEHSTDKLNTDRMIVVSSSALSDAMMVVPFSYALGYAPVLMTKPTSLSNGVKAYINENRPLTMTSYMIGGTASISSDVFKQWNLYGQPWPVPPFQNGGPI